jgi:hypothetical protein
MLNALKRTRANGTGVVAVVLVLSSHLHYRQARRPRRICHPRRSCVMGLRPTQGVKIADNLRPLCPSLGNGC